MDQGPQSEVAGISVDQRRDVLMSEDELQKALAMLEYAAAKRGMYLTVHALNKAKEVLKWELAGDRERALEANKGTSPKDKTQP
jgi:hypothetical protein